MILLKIAKITGLSEAYLARLVRTASHRYRTYTIPKRTQGTRTIDHPSKHLKFLQRWLVKNVLSHLPIHKAVYSYREGISVKDHARLHAATKYTLRIDFKDFFPSIQSREVRALLKSNLHRLPFQLTERDLSIVSSIVCKNDKLTIGAPSSPALSNAVMHDFDQHWYQRARRLGVIYSRYADDIYFSTNRPKVLSRILSELKQDLITRQSPRLILNNAKTVFTSRKRKRLITGLVVTPTGKVSTGRHRKRMIRTLVYLYSEKKLTSEQCKYLQGLLSFVRSIEPLFLMRLKKKYGEELIREIISMP